MKNVGKKHGTTFIEIILAMSIIGIISIAVFNNIFFSIKQNTLADKKQNNSIIGQMAYEEIKNIRDEKFKEMLYSLKSDTESDYNILGDNFENIIIAADKEVFKDTGEKNNQFKIYKEKQSDIYVKIFFPNLDFTHYDMGLNANYAINGSNDGTYSEWKKESECDASFIIDKENDEETEIETEYYRVIIKRGVIGEEVHYNLESNNVRGEILYESNSLTTKNKGNNPLTQELSGESANIYINNKTDKTFNFKLKNKSDNPMKIYLNQKSEGTERGKIEFSSYGEKIQIYSNDSNVNPSGEQVKTSNVCKYIVSIFNEKNGTVKNMSEIIGYKKFKRLGE